MKARRRKEPRRDVLLMLVTSLFLVAALAKPAVRLPRNTYDYLFTVDITGSMNVADVGPGAVTSRLAHARSLVRAALAALPCGSRAGLAVFTEHRSFLLFAPVEICENHLVLSTMLERVDWRMAWAERSEVAKGLYSGIEAVSVLEAMVGEGEGRQARLVFMTDGHEAPPVHPELRPRFRDESGEVSGLIAGIGGTVPEPIPWLDEEGQVAGYWTRDEVMQVDRHSLGRPTQGGEAMAGADRSDIETRIAAGNEHLSSLRESYLRQLAAETGLDYLPATNGEEFVRMLLDEKYAYRQPILTNVASVPAALGLLCLVYLFGSPVVSRLRARRGLPRARLSLET